MPSVQLRHSAATALYEQVADALRQQIHAGELKPGTAIPPESELTVTFGVSRVTARKALDLLVEEGLIVRRQGKGTFVTGGKIQQDLHALRGFAELMAERGDEQAMEVIEFGVVPADVHVARSLRLEPEASVLRIRRRHILQGAPIAYAIIHVPYDLGRRFTLEEVSTTPIYALLETRASVHVKRATQIIRAVAADQLTARQIDLPRAAPVMMIERVTYSSEDVPVEHIVFFYRGDRYELAIELFRDPTHNVLCPRSSTPEPSPGTNVVEGC
ncbi:MAG: GntR family transcriptional regulator [Armatimonadota bacterium]|nr:GntR family transcriptional regulator [Armatimonadota bacterium]